MVKSQKVTVKATDFEAKFIDSKTLASSAYAHEWLIRDVLVSRQPAVIGGPLKCLKTSLAVDMAVSLASGSPFLGKFKVDKALAVAFISGESGKATIKDTASCVCRARRLTLADLPI